MPEKLDINLIPALRAMVLDLERIAEEARYAADRARRRLEALELECEDEPAPST
jgi:hypothetical protein